MNYLPNVQKMVPNHSKNDKHTFITQNNVQKRFREDLKLLSKFAIIIFVIEYHPGMGGSAISNYVLKLQMTDDNKIHFAVRYSCSVLGGS